LSSKILSYSLKAIENKSFLRAILVFSKKLWYRINDERRSLNADKSMLSRANPGKSGGAKLKEPKAARLW
jgi:hypothetical protein